MEMKRNLMEAMKVPNQLWGEAVRHSTYLINHMATKFLVNKTPYEGLYDKKPNIDHLRVFWYVAFGKINGPHLRKLDDRSLKVINLGRQPGSKAYRLYDPVAKKVIVSRDVIFNKKQSWDYSMLASTTNDEPGTMKLTHNHAFEGGDGEEIQEHQNQDEGEIANEDEEAVRNEEEAAKTPKTNNGNQHTTTRYGRTR